jgi:hypothetical protein
VMYRCVDAHRATHGVEPMCKVLRIAPSGYWRRKLPRQVDKSEVETSALNNLGLNTTGGTSPRDSCGRYSL